MIRVENESNGTIYWFAWCFFVLPPSLIKFTIQPWTSNGTRCQSDSNICIDSSLLAVKILHCFRLAVICHWIWIPALLYVTMHFILNLITKSLGFLFTDFFSHLQYHNDNLPNRLNKMLRRINKLYVRLLKKNKIVFAWWKSVILLTLHCLKSRLILIIQIQFNSL